MSRHSVATFCAEAQGNGLRCLGCTVTFSTAQFYHHLPNCTAGLGRLPPDLRNKYVVSGGDSQLDPADPGENEHPVMESGHPAPRRSCEMEDVGDVRPQEGDSLLVGQLASIGDCVERGVRSLLRTA